jgi:hypothetical protein
MKTCVKRLVLVGAALVWLTSVAATAYGRSDVTYTIQTVDGNNGFSFVYFQAQDSHGSYPMPTRRYAGCASPYYTTWVVSDRIVPAFMTEYNVTKRNCGDGSRICPCPGGFDWVIPVMNGNRRGVAGLYKLDASGVAIYGLNVTLDPVQITAGQPAHLIAGMKDDFIASADRTLNISVYPDRWSVVSWTIDYGDGQHAALPGPGRTLDVTHTYASPGQPRPNVVTRIAGTAQIADFDPVTARPVLVDAPFTVDVTNSATGNVVARPVIGYVAPQVTAAATPVLPGGAPAASGITQIEVFRGTLTHVFIRPVIDREGYMTANGVPSGSGQTRLLTWTLVSGSRDGPAGQITLPGATGTYDQPVVQQWDKPDPVSDGAATPYKLRLSFVVRTTYPDGAQRDFPYSGVVRVLVRYSASGA